MSSIILALIVFDIKNKKVSLKHMKVTKVQWLVLAFWLVNVVACFLSPYFKKYNLFIGVGRGEGLINISLYCMTLLFITLFGEFNKRYILYFVTSALIQSLICIAQYIGFNPFNMYQEGIGTHNVSFMGTIGNKDFLSAFFCITIMTAFTSYVFSDNNRKIEAICLVTMFMSFFILGILSVLSGGVAIFATMALIMPFIITNSKRLSKTLTVGSLILLGYAINIIINPTFYYSIGKNVFKIN